MTPKFVDLHPTYNAHGYSVTNEEPEIHRMMLTTRRFKRAAAIASGGEVLFTTLLPRCQEVIAIDHSYRSLAVCFIKAILLDQLGPKGIKKLFVTSTQDQLLAEIRKVLPLLPVELQTKSGFPQSMFNDLHGLRREWFYFKNSSLEAAAKNIENLTLVHGDLTDLAKYGEFDLLYLSNALEHQDRTGRAPVKTKLLPLVKKGGLILTTGYQAFSEHTKPVRTFQGCRTQWAYKLCKRSA